MHKGPPGCLLAARCPSPSAGSWPPRCSRWLPHSGSLPCTRSCPSQPAGSGASGGIRRSSRLAATSDSWLVREKRRKLPQSPSGRRSHDALGLPLPRRAKSSSAMISCPNFTQRRKQKARFSEKPVLNLPASVSYLQSPIWISPCHGGLAETRREERLKITADSQRLLLPLSRGESPAPAPPSSMSCVSPMTWPGRSRVRG